MTSLQSLPTLSNLNLEAISTPPKLDPMPSSDPIPEDPDPEQFPSEPASEPDPEPVPSPPLEPDLLPELDPGAPL